MALQSGTKLGKYEILAPLGAGGMGEVYRALDSKLRREVAIKVLRPELAENEERLARFDREARLLGQLMHPNVAVLHGLEDEGGTRFLVMELVPGQTLSQRLAAGAMTIREVLALCRQMAEALEAAHARGVIHRDLKPSNIKVTPEGRVKVLDFGLAKALDSQAGSREDSFQTVSVHGAIAHRKPLMGTPAYMSPEQVDGKPADERADVWSFGCILYEALSGQQPFCGETIINTLAAVIGRDPDWQALPPDLPPRFRALVVRCLAKDPAGRPRDMKAVRLELEQVARELGGGGQVDGELHAHLARPGGAPPRLDPVGLDDSRTEPIPASGLRRQPQHPGHAETTTLPPRSALPTRRRRWLWPALLLVALTSAGIYLLSDRLLPVNTVAVLPFATPNNDETYRNFSESLSGQITNRLSQSKLQIAPLEKVLRVMQDPYVNDTKRAARRLSVRGIVTGEIRLDDGGKALTITARLLDTWTGRKLWEKTFSRKYDGDRPGLDTWQTLIAGEIADQVLAELKARPDAGNVPGLEGLKDGGEATPNP